MKILLGIVLAMVIMSVGRMDAKTSMLSGWVSDESCGEAHIKPEKESCVAKCLPRRRQRRSPRMATTAHDPW